MAYDDAIERSTTVCSWFNLHFPLALCRINDSFLVNFHLIFFFHHSFASFIEGESHLMDEEIQDYETTQIERDDDLNTDDEDDLMTDSDSDK